MKLLIVDDHAGVRALIHHLSALPDAAVRECASAETALAIVREFKPDVVTMDVRLPGLSGLEATKTIRAIRPATHVIVVTAYDQPSVRDAAHKAGAADFVAKDNLEQLRPVFARVKATVRNSTASAPESVDLDRKD